MQVPGTAELDLVMEQVKLALREAEAGSHSKWLALLVKFLARVRAAAMGLFQRPNSAPRRRGSAGKLSENGHKATGHIQVSFS